MQDREFILNMRGWPGQTCCLRKSPRPGEKVGILDYIDFGVITTNRFPLDVWRRDGTLAGRYNTIDELLNDGWLVD